MKKLFTFALFMVMLFGIAACTSDGADDYSYVSLEINPAMEMIINKEENVVSYSLRNEAAEIIAAGLELKDMNYEEALHLYLNAAVETGYIDTERNDNAVAIQVSKTKEEDANQFQLQVETQLNAYFGENKLGAVVLNQGEVNEAVQELVDLYDITFGFAKLVDAYVALDETHTVEEALEMTPQELIDALVGLQDAYLAQYRNQREVGAQAIKDELEVALQAKVQAHRDAVTAGTAEMPDTTGVKQAYLNNYEGLKAEFVIRNQERIEYAHAIKTGEVAQYLVGEYSYEKSSEQLPYIVTYHNFTLNSDGTYTESWSWVSRTNAQTTDGTDQGTWAVVEGILVFTNENEYSKDFEIQGARIVYEDLDGILITFKKLVTTN